MFTQNKYLYSTNNHFLDYEFDSTGPKGMIKKVARFSEMETNLYNFGFGDLNEVTGEISDTIVSNNGDGDKVLRTVASIIYDFNAIYKNAAVFIKGSSPARTRKYQMGINKYWAEIDPIFEIWGIEKGKWELFQKGQNYEAFIGRRKASFFLKILTTTVKK
jgi:hypothetical protein